MFAVFQKVFFTWCFLVLCFLPSALFAATDAFTVRTTIGSDIVPPTVPNNVIATALSATQITISWDPSSDDFELAGYHVWSSDDTIIATTTATSYTHTGLTPTTTYTYYVTAFDTSDNESASSSLASTTTQDVPATVTADESGVTFGSRFRPFSEQIVTFAIYPGETSVIIEYTTVDALQGSLMWGRTASYELGVQGENSFTKTHIVHLSDLTPLTRYSFSITGNDRFGRSGALYEGVFTTLGTMQGTYIPNVLNLTAQEDGDDIVLTWDNPILPTFDYVRIMRSDVFFPNDTADGMLVYESGGVQFRDTNILASGKRQYYTVFVYDIYGNISSGAIVTYAPQGLGTTTIIREDLNAIALSILDFQFTQEGAHIPVLSDGTIPLDGAKQFTISIPYERLPEHLKTILVHIRDPRNEENVFTFLLRVNTERSAYVATIAPLGYAGSFPLEIAVFDYATAQVGYARGTLVTTFLGMTKSTPIEGFFAGLLRLLDGYGIGRILWMSILLLLLAFLVRRLLSHDIRHTHR
jgi:hypothetical protein